VARFKKLYRLKLKQFFSTVNPRTLKIQKNSGNLIPMLLRSNLNCLEFLLIIILIFKKIISYIIRKVNPKIYWIKKLFHLPFSVRIQFYKTFILPYFDYCLSLIIYYTKYSIQKLQNFYYTCIIKLFGLSVFDLFYEDAEKKLVKYGLFSFEYRVLLKLDVFLFGILNSEFSPPCLKDLLMRKSVTYRYKTRCTDIFILPKINNHNGEATFSYFF